MAIKGCKRSLGIWMSERNSGASGDGLTPAVMPEDAYYRRLCRLAPECGLDVFLFDSASLRPSSGLLDGFRLQDGEWRPGRFALPDIVYDRSLCRNAAEKERRSAAMAELKSSKAVIPLGGSLPGKRDVYAALRNDDRLHTYLPPTFLLGAGTPIDRLAARFPNGLFLKPSSGMQGRGAVAFRRMQDGSVRLDGRSRTNEPFSRVFSDSASAFGWLERFAGAAEYIVQPYLQLSGDEGGAYDVRALVQKDESGRWAFTAAAVRQGAPGSVTSNLHGGGKASSASPALAVRFGESAAAALQARIRSVSERAAGHLEQHFGRLVELGFDFGVEPDGRLWLLEANAKPGREAFEQDERISRLAALRPLRYAAFLAARRSPIFATAALSPAFNAAT